MLQYLKTITYGGLAAAALAAVALVAMPASAQDKKPIRIGFSMAETG